MEDRCAVVRIAWAGLVLLLLAGLTGPLTADAQVNVTGQWSTLPYLMPINPIHVALLNNGKVLIVAGSANDPTVTTYSYAVWDPGAGTFNQQATLWDLFCNGMSFLADGRVFVAGGILAYQNGPEGGYPGLNTATIFDPATEKFIQVENMAHGRWYPTNTFLGDKGTVTFSGLDETGVMNQTAEIYDVGGGWSGPYPAAFNPRWYPRMHLLGNGTVIMTGTDPFTKIFDPASGTWSGTLATTNYADNRMYGSSVLLPLSPDDGYAHRIVLMGGNTAGATNTVEVLDTSLSPLSWRSLPPMSAARTTMNAVLLPNGKIVAVGGSQQFNVASTAALNAEMFDPASETWSPAGTMAFVRMYHSSALLLPDATVWVVGSNPSVGVFEPHMEIYKPPYLFTSTGAPAPRPTISSLPAVVGYGQTFTVTTPNAASISKVVLMRPGANTHAFDMEQRMLYTAFTTGSGTLSVTAPNNANVAPPGYYMLFILDQNGVPSVAKFIRLSANPTNQPPTATITNPSSATVSIQAGQSVTFAASAADPDGSIAAYQWIFPGGSPATSAVQNPGAVTFSTPGTYIVSLTVLDNLGDNNLSPPTVTVSVGGTAVLGVAITSPANGATVSGPVTVGMSATNAQGSPTSFVLKLDSATTISSQSVTGATATATWDPAGVANGTHTLNLTVTDGGGRTATASITVTVATGGGGTDTTPPTVSITSPVDGSWTGNSIDISASATDNVGLATIKLWGNGGVIATIPCSGTPCSGTVTWITGPLPPAAYEVNAVATDTSGNQTVSAKVTINKDATSPVVPSGASVGGGTPPRPLGAAITSPANGATVSGPVTVGMSATNPQGSPTSFVLKLDNATTISSQSVSGATATASWNPAGVANGTHTLNLTVTDGAGRTATASITVTVSTGGGGGADTTPPTVSITSPVDGSWTGNSIDISASATDNVGLATIKLWGNGAVFATLPCSGTTCSGTATWITGPLPPAAYEINAVATDTSGNQTVSAKITINKDATSPVVPSGASTGGGGTAPPPPLGAAITSPANGATVSGPVTVGMSATNAQGSPTSFVLKLDNATTISSQSVSGSTATASWNSTGVASGSHTLNLTVTDSAGRTATAAITVTVSTGAAGGADTTPPTVTITSPPNGAWTGNSIDVHVSGTDNVGLASLKVFGDGALVDTVPCSGASCSGVVWWLTGPLPPGQHTISAMATDTAGNQTTSPTIVINK